ncbi:toprim domain-containing protein [Candidatus Woesearchaeota archaeon]|nr:toprim domain-containing protein [Candidatus Woesearchaeota archaeon]
MDKIFDWIDSINASHAAIIVEGKKDKRSLLGLGIRNNIHMLSTMPVYMVIENVAESEKEALILTDFDKEGKDLYKRLKTGLQDHGVRVDSRLRQWLRRNTRISHIEGLLAYVKNKPITYQRNKRTI